MKRVRIMLTAIAVLAVVGGTVAFKAKKSATRFCYFAKIASPGQCTLSATTIASTLTPTTDNNFITIGATTTRLVNNVPVTQCLITDPALYPDCQEKLTLTIEQ